MKRIKTTPANRLSLQKMRKEGWTVAVVERWNSHARIRQDLFGLFDMLAFDEDIVLGIQATSRANIAHRRKKLLDNPATADWLRSVNRRIEIHGWQKQNHRWQCKIESIEV